MIGLAWLWLRWLLDWLRPPPAAPDYAQQLADLDAYLNRWYTMEDA